MALHVVSYDLMEGDLDAYPELRQLLRLGFDNHSHPQESVWIVESDLTATEIQSRVLALLRPQDRLLVATIDGSKIEHRQSRTNQGEKLDQMIPGNA